MGFKDRLKNVFASTNGEDSTSNVQLEKTNPTKIELSSRDVLFVCSSNTVVSPIGEAIFNMLSKDSKAFSAGLNAQAGNEASQNAIVASAMQGVELSGHVTKNINDFSFDNVGLILTSTTQIRDYLTMKYSDLKIYTIKEYSGGFSDWDIDEPISEDFIEYQNCFMEIFDAVSKIAKSDDIFEKSTDSSDMPAQSINFAYLDYLIHSGQKSISLASDVELDDDEVLNYKDGIKLDVDGLSIDGNGHTIDAKGKVRIFECIAKDITIKNVTFKCGFVKDYGGAIYNDGELTVEGSRFEKNACGSRGGAIYNSADMALAGSEFDENSSRFDGGAIYNNDVLSVDDCKFNGNSADGDGGAIYNWDELKIDDSTFNGNASRNGGAIFNIRGLSVVDSTIIRNASHELGGAVYNTGNANIEDSTLEENVAGECGGAIYNYNGAELTISKSAFNKNSSNKHGAVMGNISANLNVLKCEISNNNSPKDIIYNEDYLQVLNSDFIQNHSRHIIVNRKKEAITGIFNGQFSDNNVLEAVIFNFGKSCTIEKSIFENNFSDNNSLNIINHTESTLTVPKIMDEGRTVLNEGHIFVKNPSPGFLDKIFGDGVLETNIPAGGKESDFECLDEKIHIDYDYEDEWIKITFDGKIREIELKSDFALASYEYEFYEGGIELDIDDVVIDGMGNTIDAKGKSRIFLITGKNVTIKNMTFKNGRSYSHYSSSNNNGGAIRINNDGNSVLINCIFESNISDGWGGAMYNRDGDLSISESIFAENVSELSGGAISHTGSLTIKNSVLTDNMSGRSGGAISCLGISNMENCKICGNSADSGGAISNSGKMTIKMSILKKNKAENHHGGAIDNSDELTVIDSDFGGNFAERDGGAIHNNYAELSLFGSAFSGNRANENGDAIFNYRETSFKAENCDLAFWDVEKYNEYD